MLPAWIRDFLLSTMPSRRRASPDLKFLLLRSNAGDEARTACGNLVNFFDAALRLLHPVMPFITEEIWHAIYDGKPPLRSVALASYPQVNEEQINLAAETEMAVLQDLIVSVRQLRLDLKVEARIKIPIELFVHDAGTGI